MTRPPPVRIQCLSIADLRRRPAALDPLVELARPYYLDPQATVRSAADRSDLVYLATGDGEREDRPLGCFFVSWHQAISAPPPFVAVAYGGLAVTREDSLGGGVLRRLLESWRDDARQEERRRGPLLLWGMTCLPFVLDLAHEVFASVRPGLDGSSDEGERELARLLREHPAGEDPHPFVLRGATFSRYRPEAYAALLKVRSRSQEWMQELGLDEQSGDRLLFHFRCGE